MYSKIRTINIHTSTHRPNCMEHSIESHLITIDEKNSQPKENEDGKKSSSVETENEHLISFEFG